MSRHEISSSKDLDWENRVLCSDESCIGVVGPDGRCKECGTPFTGELPAASPNVQETIPFPSTEPGTPQAERVDAIESDTDLESAEDIDEEWAKRQLCSDESCIGVIGPDGRCKECGKTA